MVSRVFIDRNTELVELLDRFVAMKFCETDDKGEYYRSAGYFLPQWYWQPILAVCYPDGREINLHWRHTHESFPVKTVVDIMKKALAITGDGISTQLARKSRASLNEAEDALTLQEYDKALRLARQVSAVEGVERDGEVAVAVVDRGDLILRLDVDAQLLSHLSYHCRFQSLAWLDLAAGEFP